MGQPTPSSKLGQHRSKLAGALRNGADLDQLSSIDEEQLQQHASRQAQHAQQVQQAQAQQAMHAQQQQQQQFQQPPQQRGPELSHSQSQSKARYAPSMPPLRARPRVCPHSKPLPVFYADNQPVMPVPLGKSGSEPQEPSNKRDMRQSMYPQSQSQFQGHGLAPPNNMGDGQESALGLENMHIHPDQQRQGQGQGMKAPTVGLQSWYAN